MIDDEMINEETKEQIRFTIKVVIETYKILIEELEKSDLPKKAKEFILNNFKAGEK